MTRCGVDQDIRKTQLCSLSKGNEGVRRQFPLAHTRKLRGIHFGSYRVNRRLLED